MKHALLLRLASPNDGGPLHLEVTAREGEEITAGCLTNSSGHQYPIEDGIPRLLPAALLDAQRSEIAARDAQVDDYDRMAFLHAFGRVEIPLTAARPGAAPQRPSPGGRLRDGPDDPRAGRPGAGTGRHRLLLRSPCAPTSESSAPPAYATSTSSRPTCATCRSRRASFDRVVSCQVLEHVPGTAAQGAAVAELARVLPPGGRLALSAYKHSLLTRLFAEKEGAHDGGIPFFRFTAGELRAQLAPAFAVERLTGALVYIYLAQCTKR